MDVSQSSTFLHLVCVFVAVVSVFDGASGNECIHNGYCSATRTEGLSNSFQASNLPFLGKQLRAAYKSASPYPHIVLDHLFDPKLLNAVLSAVKEAPKGDWVGPESSAGCCHNKFRIPFSKIVHRNKHVSRLRDVYRSKEFIEFLENLTGIDSLVTDPDNDRELMLESSVIAIRKGGYLHIHNDFTVKTGPLYRRVNVLLYLNKNWKPEYKGTLDLYGPKLFKGPRQKILPRFNRVVIFTVTPDAYHGHPEPLAPPDEDTERIGLQFTYYTAVRGPDFYPQGAIFQMHCDNAPGMDNFCENDARYPFKSGMPEFDLRFCKCHEGTDKYWHQRVEAMNATASRRGSRK
eukprot:GFYU01000259.1.p1 GENE.GFYU01000259.1~~GFYU01000259.1.p1  ORF type:complete len:364 (+),score=16.86 GFYU01000259.1:54-1094(+)